MRSIELITWCDSYGCSASWQEVNNDPISLQPCYSAGFILKEDDKHVVIASHYAQQNDLIGSVESACGDMTIPKCSILDRKILTVKYDMPTM